MTLAHPEWLWALLALPLLWWLSRPPRPRRHLWTAHLAQWQAALSALRRRPPRGAPLRFLLLALALVAAALAAGGATLPGAPGPRRLLVLFDGSASMAARDADGRSAFERARARLRERLAAVPPHVAVTLLRLGGPMLRRYDAAARAGMDLGAPDGALVVDPGLLARELAAGGADADGDAPVLWTLTDGQGQRALPTVGALDTFPTVGANAALLDVRLDDRWPLPALRLTVEAVAFAPGAAPIELQALVEGAVVATAPQRRAAPSGQRETFVFELQRAPEGGALRVAVSLPDLAPDGDLLPADDAREVLLPPLPAPRIAVLGDQDAGPFVEVAAEALAEEVGGSVVPVDTGDEVGLLLVDGGVVAVPPGRARALTFGTDLDGRREPEPWQAPAGIDWAREHPLTRGLDLSELRVERAFHDLLPAGEAFLWADGPDGPTPLAVVVDGPQPSVHFAFRLRDANLPLLAAFPQLLRRAFVQSHGAAALPVWAGAPPPPGEQDLTAPATAPDRPLPPFGREDRELGGWLVLAGLCALALRAWVR
ncbi:MAG: hypothetical protein H6835_12345 [Planctomycetes bacterium]|nr:hypothetical protein [Planctomycetota bacterium]